MVSGKLYNCCSVSLKNRKSAVSTSGIERVHFAVIKSPGLKIGGGASCGGGAGVVLTPCRVAGQRGLAGF